MNFIQSSKYKTGLKDEKNTPLYNLPVNLDVCESYYLVLRKVPELVGIEFRMCSGKSIEWWFKDRAERNMVKDKIDEYIAKFNDKSSII